MTQGPKIGQVSLSFGADDLGSIMIEENVVYAAGARNRMTQDEMRRLIADAGYEPVQRRTLYDACKDSCCTSPIPVPKPRGATLPVPAAASIRPSPPRRPFNSLSLRERVGVRGSMKRPASLLASVAVGLLCLAAASVQEETATTSHRPVASASPHCAF